MAGIVWFLGWVALVALCLLAALVVVVALIRFWPIRVTFITAGQRARQSRVPARIDWRNNCGGVNPLHALIGLSSRGKSRWFFGLMLLGENEFDRDLQWPKIVTRKPAALSPSQPEVERLRAENERLTDALAKAGEFQERFRAENERLREAVPDLSSVIAWLDNGCDPKHAADELRIYQARIARAFLSSLSTETGNG